MIVVDTNIIIAALIKDSVIRKIIIESGLQFAYPEISFVEIQKHKNYILNKSGYDKNTLEKILNKLFEYINLIPIEIIKPRLKEAKEIMDNIDVKDTIFIATALALDKSAIWSDDEDFQRQDIIKVFKTRDILSMIQKQS